MPDVNAQIIPVTNRIYAGIISRLSPEMRLAFVKHPRGHNELSNIITFMDSDRMKAIVKLEEEKTRLQKRITRTQRFIPKDFNLLAMILLGLLIVSVALLIAFVPIFGELALATLIVSYVFEAVIFANIFSALGYVLTILYKGSLENKLRNVEFEIIDIEKRVAANLTTRLTQNVMPDAIVEPIEFTPEEFRRMKILHYRLKEYDANHPDADSNCSKQKIDHAKHRFMGNTYQGFEVSKVYTVKEANGPERVISKDDLLAHTGVNCRGYQAPPAAVGMNGVLRRANEQQIGAFAGAVAGVLVRDGGLAPAILPQLQEAVAGLMGALAPRANAAPAPQAQANVLVAQADGVPPAVQVEAVPAAPPAAPIFRVYASSPQQRERFQHLKAAAALPHSEALVVEVSRHLNQIRRRVAPA